MTSKCTILSFGIRKGLLHLTMSCNCSADQVKGVLWIYQGSGSRQVFMSRTDGRASWTVSVTDCHVGKTLIKVSFRPENLDFEMTEWKLVLLLHNGLKVPCIVRNPFLRKSFYLRDRSLKYLTDHGEIYYLFLLSTYEIALVRRIHSIYDDQPYRIKEAAARLIFSLTGFWWKRQRIWLFFEKESRTAQDNGYVFYRYCRRNHLDQKLGVRMYFVNDKKDAARGILAFYSMRHMLYLLASQVLISSESREQAVKWRSRNSFLRDSLDRKKLIFLQHGVIGLKKLPQFDKDSGGRCDLFITSSEREKDIVVRELGYRPEQVVITGLARWDLLKDRSRESLQRQILMLPTWRTWLDDISPESFACSEFFQNCRDLLTNERLKRLLSEENCRLTFCLHPKAEHYSSLFTPLVPESCDAIRIVSYHDIKLNHLLMESVILITDYSSLAWDMFYMGKKVVFFQPDQEQYLKETGSYLNFQDDLFGKTVYNANQLINLISESFHEGRDSDSELTDKRKEDFAYIDHHNCERIAEALEQYIDEQTN